MADIIMRDVDCRLQRIKFLLNRKPSNDQIVQEFNDSQKVLRMAEEFLVNQVRRWSFSKRREANEQAFGGIPATPNSIAELEELESQIGKFVDLQYRLFCLTSQCAYETVRQAGRNNLSMLPKFVQQTTVVSKLTTQIMRKEKRFEVALRILSAPALLQCYGVEPISVNYYLVNEVELNHVLSDFNYPIKPAAKLATMKERAREKATNANQHDEKGRWHFYLKADMTRKRRHASDSDTDADGSLDPTPKKQVNDPAVTATKAALLFQVQINWSKNCTWIFRVASMPIVLITHATQELASWCTVFWDNAFSNLNRKPFEVPELIDCDTFLSGLTRWFFGRTGFYLVDEQLAFLRSCLPNWITVESLQLEPQDKQELQFPFWLWFYKCTRLIEKVDQLQEFCKRGLFHGFISLNRVRSLLLQSPNSAVLRFCTSHKKGAFTIFRRRDIPPFYNERYKLESLGCWKLKHFKRHGFFFTLDDLEVREIAQVGNWLEILNVDHKKLADEAHEFEIAGNNHEADGFVNVPIRNRIALQ